MTQVLVEKFDYFLKFNIQSVVPICLALVLTEIKCFFLFIKHCFLNVRLFSQALKKMLLFSIEDAIDI